MRENTGGSVGENNHARILMFYRWLYLAYLAGHLAVQVRAQVYWAYDAAVFNDYCYPTNISYAAWMVTGGNAVLAATGTFNNVPGGGAVVFTVKGVADSVQGYGPLLAGSAGPVAVQSGRFWFVVGGCTNKPLGQITNSLGPVPYTNTVTGGFPNLKPVFARRRLPGGGYTNAIIGFYSK